MACTSPFSERLPGITKSQKRSAHLFTYDQTRLAALMLCAGFNTSLMNKTEIHLRGKGVRCMLDTLKAF